MGFNVQKSQPHTRRIIRHQIRDLLKKYVDVSQRVFLGRPDPVFFSEIPCVLVSFNDEVIDDQKTAPMRFKRRLSVLVDVMHEDRPNIAGDIDNELDDYFDSRAFEIEYAILHDPWLELGEAKAEFLTENPTMTRQQSMLIRFEGDQKIAALRIEFNIVYETTAELYGTLEEFLKFDAVHQTTIGAQAEDNVIIRTS